MYFYHQKFLLFCVLYCHIVLANTADLVRCGILPWYALFTGFYCKIITYRAYKLSLLDIIQVSGHCLATSSTFLSPLVLKVTVGHCIPRGDTVTE